MINKCQEIAKVMLKSNELNYVPPLSMHSLLSPGYFGILWRDHNPFISLKKNCQPLVTLPGTPGVNGPVSCWGSENWTSVQQRLCLESVFHGLEARKKKKTKVIVEGTRLICGQLISNIET